METSPQPNNQYENTQYENTRYENTANTLLAEVHDAEAEFRKVFDTTGDPEEITAARLNVARARSNFNDFVLERSIQLQENGKSKTSSTT